MAHLKLVSSVPAKLVFKRDEMAEKLNGFLGEYETLCKKFNMHVDVDIEDHPMVMMSWEGEDVVSDHLAILKKRESGD